MEPSRCVNEDHIHVPGFGRLQAVEHHGGRVGSLVLPDDIRAASFCPDFQLVGSGGTEGIPRHQQHLLALTHKLLGQLPDGGGLAHAVDPDYQDHGGLGRKVQLCVPHVQHIHQNLFQGGFCFLRGL